MSNELEQVRTQAHAYAQRAFLAERLCERYRRAFLQMLQESFTDLDTTITRLLDALATTLNVDRVGLWLFDKGETEIRCARQHPRQESKNIGPTTLKRDEYPEYFAAISQHLTLAITDATTDPRTRELLARYLLPLGISAMLDVPVRTFGSCIGILCHEHTTGLREWTLEDQHFAAGVATQVALAYERDRVKRMQEKLLHRSLIDQETLLPNYLHFENDVGDRLEAATASIAVVVARTDQHRLLAQTYGRKESITLLQLIVARLSSHLPNNARMARIASEEFALLIESASPQTLVANIAYWTSALRKPLTAGKQRIFLTLSTGFAVCETSVKLTAEQLITNARLAMQQARLDGGARTVPFVQAMRERLENRLQIEQELRSGMARHEFVLHFQPIVNLQSMRCIGAEALLRWQHPSRGLLSPDEFMSVAMESGAILELGRQTLRAACQGLVRIREQTQNPELTVAVNMSAAELLASDTAYLARAELRRAGLPPTALILEVTETSLLDDLDTAAMMLRSIRSSGIRISLDDFGTAFSSLSWMHTLPIDSVKIDRGFVEGIPNNPHSVTLVRAITDLSRAFDREVIAEGIETEQQLIAIREMGITMGQGFLFAKAKPSECYTRKWIERLGKE